MKEVMVWMWNSRTVWVSTVTTLLVAVLVKYGCPVLGLTEEQATQVAITIVVLALAVIGKLAAQNVVAIAKGESQEEE